VERHLTGSDEGGFGLVVVLVVVLGAMVLGRLRGGSIQALGRLTLPGWPLVFLALAAQALGSFAEPLGLPAPRGWYVAGMALSAVLIVVFVARNRELAGMALIAAGFLFNAIVIASNGAMPVSERSASRAGLVVHFTDDDAKHELMTERTRLRWLADVIPVPLPGAGSNVLSLGDVVLAAGIGVLVANAMLLRERPAGSGRLAGRPL
jgi:hypothetical protein